MAKYVYQNDRNVYQNGEVYISRWQSMYQIGRVYQKLQNCRSRILNCIENGIHIAKH